MKVVIILALVVVAVVAAHPHDADDYSRYENFDVDELCNNLRLLKAYVACFIGTGRCTPEASDFKKWIPGAIQSVCAKCSDRQKYLVATVMKAISQKLPEEWKKLQAIHNPNGKHTSQLNQFMATYSKA